MNHQVKFYSAIYAIAIYLLVLGFLITYFNHHSEKPKSIHFVKKNDNRIEVGLKQSNQAIQESQKSPQDKSKNIKDMKKTPKEKPIKKKKIVKKPEKKKIIEKKKVPEKKKIVEKKKVTKNVEKKSPKKPKINKLFEKIKDKEPNRTASPKSNNKSHIKSSMKDVESKDQGIINEYFAKVEETLYYWPAMSEFAGEKAEVWLKIEQDGSFIFKLTKYSNNPDFNSGLIQYLEQLQRVGFARHEQSRSLEARVEFIAEE